MSCRYSFPLVLIFFPAIYIRYEVEKMRNFLMFFVISLFVIILNGPTSAHTVNMQTKNANSSDQHLTHLWQVHYDERYETPRKRKWRSYRRKYEDEIYKFGQGPSRNLPRDKAAYYYYNYKRGYITDNCEYIRAPVRKCSYLPNDKRKCRWTLRWQYKCF